MLFAVNIRYMLRNFTLKLSKSLQTSVSFTFQYTITQKYVPNAKIIMPTVMKSGN